MAKFRARDSAAPGLKSACNESTLPFCSNVAVWFEREACNSTGNQSGTELKMTGTP
jgi:hypothetical protein